MKYTQVRADAFQTLQMNAGIMVDSFNPATGVIGNILGATTGGFSFASNPTYQDFGEDVDNVPPNTWQLKRILYYDPAVSGTFLTVTALRAKNLTGAADVDSDDSTHVVPRNTLKDTDFMDVWVIGDYSDVNTGANAGYLAVHLMNVLNTAGIQWQTAKDGKGQFSFDYHGHYDLNNIDTIPFEIYCKSSSTEPFTPYVRLDKHALEMSTGEATVLSADTFNGIEPYWTSSSVNNVAVTSNGDGSATVYAIALTGTSDVTAYIVVNGVEYSDTCNVAITD